MAALSASNARHPSGRKLSFEETGVIPEGVRDLLQPKPAQDDPSHLYIFELASSGRGRVVYKVGMSKNVYQRASEIRNILKQAGRYTNWTVVLSALFPNQGHTEAAVHEALRSIPGAQHKQSGGHRQSQGPTMGPL